MMTNIPKVYQGKPLVHSWSYIDATDNQVGIVGRYQNGSDKKDIVPFFKRNGSGFMPGIELEPRPLFGLNLLANHDKNKAIFIVEGEKSAAALQGLGVTACNRKPVNLQSVHFSTGIKCN